MLYACIVHDAVHASRSYQDPYEQRDIPNLEFSPNHVSIGFSQIAFPIIVPAKG